MFLDALSYPFRGGGWIMIILGAIFSAILDLTNSASIIGLGAGIFAFGYFGSFYLDIVNATMTGHDEIPEWPSFMDFLDDIISPFFRLCWLVFASFWPVIAVGIFLQDHSLWFVPALIAALLLGCVYFPMAVLALQAHGSYSTALPHVVIPGIFRALPGYLLAVIALMITFGVCLYAQEVAAKVPYAGWFLTSALALYSLMFQARLIGLSYRSKRDELGWE